MLKIGILSVQGAFREHMEKIKEIGLEAKEVRNKSDLSEIDGLIIPGGESTSMGIICNKEQGFVDSLRSFRNSKAVWGTCAGMIFLANEVRNQKQGGQLILGGLDCIVERNYFGSQIDSFEIQLKVAELGDEPIKALFIRSPIVVQKADNVSILAQLPTNEIVAVRQKNILATSFHPELTKDTRWHRYFAKMVQEYKLNPIRP